MDLVDVVERARLLHFAKDLARVGARPEIRRVHEAVDAHGARVGARLGADHVHKGRDVVILGGVNRKTLCAILGTISGVAFAALFGELACALLRVNGYKMYSAEPTIEALLQIKQGQDPMHSLQLGDLLVGGIVIAALGAVNDVAMSISSAMNELVAVNPALTRRQLLRSGMNIGRDMVGTMTNTLILALVGSSLVLMIYLSSLEPSFSQLMSGTFFSVEMVQAIASSVGVILAVPLSALIGAFLFAKHKK